MNYFLEAVAAGAAAGALHVVSGPDHLAVVAPLAARARAPGWHLGFRWGLGHAGGVALVGVAAVGLREMLPLSTVSSWSERVVGISLLVVGIWAFAGVRRILVEGNGPGEGSALTLLLPGPSPEGRHEHPLRSSSTQRREATDVRAGVESRAALAVGVLHGTAGGAHLVGVLPALILSTHLAAASYLVTFGLGTVAAMVAFASLVGRAGSGTLLAGPRAYAGFMGCCAALAVAAGLWWLVP